jgi:hypothetical protein
MSSVAAILKWTIVFYVDEKWKQNLFHPLSSRWMIHPWWSSRMSNVNLCFTSIHSLQPAVFSRSSQANHSVAQQHLLVLQSLFRHTLNGSKKSVEGRICDNVHYPWIFLKGRLVHNLIQHKPGNVLNKIYFFVNCSALSHQQVWYSRLQCNFISL